jgi:anti-sigma B factor antagonist
LLNSEKTVYIHRTTSVSKPVGFETDAILKMEIRTLKNSDDIYLIELQGSLDLYYSNQLKELIMDMIKKKSEKFIIDMEKVESINSSGIGALIFISSTIKKVNAQLVIAKINDLVKKAMELSKLSGYFRIAGSLREALDLIQQEG